EEFKKGLNLGYKHFVILADDTGGYGRDIGESLPHLLDEITRIKGNYSIELRDVHPVWIAKYVDELERILKRRKISMIFSGTQSGNERVLKLMNRYSDVDVVEQTFLRLKNASPEMVWGTECIVGFPTENRNEFIDSLKFISTVNFDFGFLHPFSCKHGTEAEGIEPKIPQREIEDRLVFSRRYLKRKGFRIYYGFKPALTFWR
ncbi:MAG TPA: radical SAM protein, partial [Thermoplasmatales archaeon]|nr:radical SAM protein [Thermoplasmatales archaeon]